MNVNWNDQGFQGFGGQSPFERMRQAAQAAKAAGESKPKKPRKSISSPVGRTLVNLLVTVLFGAVYYYVALPPLNVHSGSLYVFVVLLCLVYCVCASITSGVQATSAKDYGKFLKKQCLIPAVLVVAAILVGIVGSIAGWKVFRAAAYRDLLTVTDGDFAAEVEEISFRQIPMLDRDSATKLGNRKLGELADMVSQFEVAADYTQINYRGRPVRVTPLEYGDIIKWFNNRSKGLPAYLVIDMVTQNVDVVRLTDGIHYTTAEHFSRNLYRYLRFRYPTFIFDTPAFEIDEQGNPWWVCPRITKTIGLFSGTDITGAVLVNAVTGECAYYDKAGVPEWVDHVFTADLIIRQYDYHGVYVHGWLNSLFGQRDVTKTTDGYNYIAINDDVYMYTGITSVVSDESNIGFILSNQRTKETHFFSVAGAEEYSAMDSAQGQVQQMRYTATFPLLLNISQQPTYFMALKDAAGLVKMYAMVNVSQYQIVATGATVAECQNNYRQMLLRNGLIQGEEAAPVEEEDMALYTVDGVITDIRSAVIEGNTHYYIRLKNSESGDVRWYEGSVADVPYLALLSVDDQITLRATAGDGMAEAIYDVEGWG